MLEFVIAYLPWLLSAITIYSVVLAGNRDRKSWSLAFLNQGLWLVWIVSSSAWGLLPMNIAMSIVSVRNYRKWSHPEASGG